MENLKKLFETAKENVGFLFISLAVVAAILVAAYGAERFFDRKNGNKKEKEKFKVHRLALVAMLSAIAIILNMFSIPLGFLPSFYKIDLSELPVILGAFTMGPVAGVAIEFVKIMLNLLVNGTSTAFVGEFANFVIGCSFVVPASILYYSRKTKKNAVFGLVLGTAACILAGCLMNAYVLLPAYSKAFHMGIENLVAMGTEKNGLITGMSSFVIFAVAPFNLLKCGAVSILIMLVYKKISHLLKAGRL